MVAGGGRGCRSRELCRSSCVSFFELSSLSLHLFILLLLRLICLSFPQEMDDVHCSSSSSLESFLGRLEILKLNEREVRSLLTRTKRSKLSRIFLAPFPEHYFSFFCPLPPFERYCLKSEAVTSLLEVTYSSPPLFVLYSLRSIVRSFFFSSSFTTQKYHEERERKGEM